MDIREKLARDLHEAARESVEKGATVAATLGNEKMVKFREWDEIDEVAREGRRMQADYLLKRYFIRKKAEEPKAEHLPLFVREIFNQARREAQEGYSFSEETLDDYTLVLAGNPENNPNEFWFVEKATDAYKAHISPAKYLPGDQQGWTVRATLMPDNTWAHVSTVETLADAISFLYMYYCLRFK
jgi:hypothetical protein